MERHDGAFTGSPEPISPRAFTHGNTGEGVDNVQTYQTFVGADDAGSKGGNTESLRVDTSTKPDSTLSESTKDHKHQTLRPDDSVVSPVSPVYPLLSAAEIRRILTPLVARNAQGRGSGFGGGSGDSNKTKMLSDIHTRVERFLSEDDCNVIAKEMHNVIRLRKEQSSPNAINASPTGSPASLEVFDHSKTPKAPRAMLLGDKARKLDAPARHQDTQANAPNSASNNDVQKPVQASQTPITPITPPIVIPTADPIMKSPHINSNITTFASLPPDPSSSSPIPMRTKSFVVELKSSDREEGEIDSSQPNTSPGYRHWRPPPTVHAPPPSKRGSGSGGSFSAATTLAAQYAHDYDHAMDERKPPRRHSPGPDRNIHMSPMRTSRRSASPYYSRRTPSPHYSRRSPSLYYPRRSPSPYHAGAYTPISNSIRSSRSSSSDGRLHHPPHHTVVHHLPTRYHQDGWNWRRGVIDQERRRSSPDSTLSRDRRVPQRRRVSEYDVRSGDYYSVRDCVPSLARDKSGRSRYSQEQQEQQQQQQYKRRVSEGMVGYEHEYHHHHQRRSRSPKLERRVWDREKEGKGNGPGPEFGAAVDMGGGKALLNRIRSRSPSASDVDMAYSPHIDSPVVGTRQNQDQNQDNRDGEGEVNVVLNYSDDVNKDGWLPPGLSRHTEPEKVNLQEKEEEKQERMEVDSRTRRDEGEKEAEGGYVKPCHNVPGLWMVKCGVDAVEIVTCEFEIDNDTMERWGLGRGCHKELPGLSRCTNADDRDDRDDGAMAMATTNANPKANANTNQERLSLSLRCMQLAEVTAVHDKLNLAAVTPAEVTGAMAQIQAMWPPQGDLVVEVNPGKDWSRVCLPRHLGRADIDITANVHEGINVIRFVQLQRLDDYVFVVLAKRKSSPQELLIEAGDVDNEKGEPEDQDQDWDEDPDPNRAKSRSIEDGELVPSVIDLVNMMETRIKTVYS